MGIAYDFDGTLAPGNMQEHQFLPDIGMKPTQFLEACGPMFTRSLQLRQAVLGAPAQALTRPAD